MPLRASGAETSAVAAFFACLSTILMMTRGCGAAGLGHVMSRHNLNPGALRRPLGRGSRRNPSSSLVSLPRALSKLGHCSRTEALGLIDAGRVTVDGQYVRSPVRRVDLARARIAIDGEVIVAQDKIYMMLNKPRGFVTTRRDPQERRTVYDCLSAELPFLTPVGRLDKASEGLLLLTNDTRWADYLLDPVSGVAKTYHVKIDRVADEDFIAALRVPIFDGGEWLRAVSAQRLRASGQSSWIEIVLTEGRNRQVRRMIAAQGASVVRLVRVGIGGVSLGTLEKGGVRTLTQSEYLALVSNRGGSQPGG